MTSAIYARTQHMGLGLLNFNFPNWADDANENLKILDAGFSVLGVTIKGPWLNNTAYAVGEIAVDTSNNTLWRCNVANLSPTTGTFLAYRTANPTHWSDATYITVPDAPINGVTYGRKDNSWVPISGNEGVFTAPITVRPATGNAALVLDKASGIDNLANVVFGKTNTLTRWALILGGATPETGSNDAGSNFALARYNDNGGAIDDVMTCTRAGGIPNFANGLTTPTLTVSDNSTRVATTQFVKDQGYAPLANPVFTGNPRITTTPTPGDNDTSIASTAFVQEAVNTAFTDKNRFFDRYYTSSGPASWTVPAGLRFAEVWVQGGGGGGGSATSSAGNTMCGSGGGGGAYGHRVYDAATLGPPSTVISMTIGGGGAPSATTNGATGGTGGTTTFGSLSATGGAGGANGSNSNAATFLVGGSPSFTVTGSAEEIFSGSQGATAFKFAGGPPYVTAGGSGGAAGCGAGGSRTAQSSGVTLVAALMGAGGGGGTSLNATGDGIGAAGGNGFVHVREWY